MNWAGSGEAKSLCRDGSPIRMRPQHRNTKLIALAGAMALSLLVASSFSSASGGVIPLDDKPVTRKDFEKAFDTGASGQATILNSSTFSFDTGFTGTVRSQVFKGTGSNAGLYAYLYQVTAPNRNRNDVTQLRIPDPDPAKPEYTGFIGGPQEATVAGGPWDSIHISSGTISSTSPMGGFTLLGSIQPNGGSTGVEQETFPDEPPRVSFFYSTTTIRGLDTGGETGYIVGLFSRFAPRLGTLLVFDASTLKKIRAVSAYVPSPEPGAFVLFGVGCLLCAGGRGMARLRARRARRPDASLSI